MRTFFILVLFVICGCEKIEEHGLFYKSGFIQVTQGRLHYRSYGKGDPIIILHGGPGMMNSSYLIPGMLELAKTNRVIVYDQRGSGKSSNTVIGYNQMNLEKFTIDLDLLVRGLSLDKVILIGHSWGGIIAMNYATEHPENVSKLILMDTAPADHQGIIEFEEAARLKTQAIAKEVAPLYSEETLEQMDIKDIKHLYSKLFISYVYNPEDAKKINLDFSKTSVISGVRSMQELVKSVWMNKDFNLFPSLKRMRIPTLIIYGKEDLTPINCVQKINEAIKGSKIYYIENCGHFPFIEKPKETFDGINDFLNEKRM